jgi:hypothetical protein
MKSWTARLDFLAAISVKILRCFYNNNTIPTNQKNSIIVLKTKENQKYENSWWRHNEVQEVDVEAKHSRFGNCKSVHSRARTTWLSTKSNSCSHSSIISPCLQQQRRRQEQQATGNRRQSTDELQRNPRGCWLRKNPHFRCDRAETKSRASRHTDERVGTNNTTRRKRSQKHVVQNVSNKCH